tara:strand:- start:291 stop:728 length:438 start_codon:yes stop_codon:yes gene_type:complete
MKYLYWVWFVVLVTALFQAGGPIFLAVNGDETASIPESFFGVLMILALLTIIIFLFWILGPIARPIKNTGIEMVQRGGRIDEDLKLIFWTRLDAWGRARIALSFVLLFFAGIGILFWFAAGLVGWVYRAYLDERDKDRSRPDQSH